MESGERCSCRNLTGGVSNRTVRVARVGRPNLIVKQALSRLRVKVVWHSSPQRIHREFKALQVFAELLPGQVPFACFEDSEQHVIGMEEVPVPYYNWKEQMLSGIVETRHWASFGTMLIRIHTATNEALAGIPNDLWDKTFFESLRLEPYYGFSKRQETAAATFLEELITETRPLEVALVHGDYSPKNVLICGEVLHLLDYEVCHVGDPAFDVGFALTHALSKSLKLPQKRQVLLECALQFWLKYSNAGTQEFVSSSLELRAVKHTLGCLLARAVGRSPLEYLNHDQRAWQARTVLDLIQRAHINIPDLIEDFRQRLSPMQMQE